MKLKTIHYAIFFIVIAFGGLFAARIWGESQPGLLDEFAQCVADSDAIFYGAFWCPACEDQKRLFGNSTRLLPYVECSTPDGQSQLPACTEAEIKNYPTWEFGDGSRQSGLIPLQDLAAKTGCSLPEA